MKYIFGILFLVTSVLRGATWDQLPLAYGLHSGDCERIQKSYDVLHPWKPGGVMPDNFEAAGLASPVTLVACDIYLDGGSRFYLFRGSNDKFLVICTDAGSYYDSRAKKSVEVRRPRLFLGTFHFSEKPRAELPEGSKTERFLLEAIRSEVDRLTPKKK